MRHPAIKLLSKGGIVTVLVVLINVGAVYLLRSNTRWDSFYWVAFDKQERLASLTRPKIVFVGGSALVFALNSQLVDDHFPGYDVANMGFQAGTGLRYPITQAKAYLNPGDVLVIVPEYDYFYFLFNSSPNAEALYLMLMVYPGNIRFISHPSELEALVVQHTKKASTLMPRLLFDTLGEDFGCSDVETTYCRTSVNEYGDIVTGFDADKSYVAESYPQYQLYMTYDQESTDYLNALYEELSQKDVLVIIIPPPVALSNYEFRGFQYDAVYEDITGNTPIPFLASPSDHVYPDNYFYDTHYHLLPDYRDMYTQAVIGYLDEVITPLEP